MTAAGPLRFPPDPRQVRVVRQQVRERAGRMGAGETLCDAAALVVDELVNNAIEHGASYRTPKGRGLFLISIYMEELRVDVAPGGGMRLLGSLNPA